MVQITSNRVRQKKNYGPSLTNPRIPVGGNIAFPGSTYIVAGAYGARGLRRFAGVECEGDNANLVVFAIHVVFALVGGERCG